MNTEDGQAFVKNLAYFVRTHEKALANALHLQKQPSKHASSLSGSSSLAAFGFSSQHVKPAKMTLTPHHLYYLLSRFEEMNISVGPMNVRLENIHADLGPANYVSFLGSVHKSKGTSDRDSIHSISSIRSVMSGMSALWSNLGLSSDSNAKLEKQKLALQEDLKYLYSAFTKIPCLRVGPDNKARLIAGYEEFPFDSAVPLYAFKNLGSLEICDLDFRQFFGWDKLAEQLRSLTIKRGSVDDPADILSNIVLDDMDRRRRRSAKSPSSATLPWPAPSPSFKPPDSATSAYSPESPLTPDRRVTLGSPRGVQLMRSGSRESGSSGSSRATTPRSSSTNLVLNALPASKWRFLRHLSLADNGLTTLSALSLWPMCNTLQSFDLSSNHFGEVPDSLASLTSLRALNLSNCMISSLHSLTRSPLPAITTLNLRANRLASIAGIEGLLALERLDLRDNKITDPDELARVTSLPNIREIYVSRNPFTKTHSNFRVTIFNLFRKMPGYTEDILIDTTGPSYTERKQLVDRAPERTVIPVVKPPQEEDTSPASPQPKRQALDYSKITAKDPSSRTEPANITEGYSPGTQRRRKAPKKRLVELSTTESWQRSHSESVGSPEGALDEIARDHVHNSPGQNTMAQYQGGHREQSDLPSFDGSNTARLSIPMTNGSTEAGREEYVNSTLTGEAYRRKIEALRNDLGNTWLSALGDDGWAGQKPSGQFPEKDVSPPAYKPHQEGRSMSQGITSGTRT
ncbi:hypothetical protein EV356DRAFT_447297 [Viridothelium virens]|uniref:L domain-like protein n=1 Tax=Viridothelium virens TaxID=1048519 RepID=A0A6A6H864_VIRVR|nr:hypothetical protein EV356DRAFT_447297 [Viridothelium virens]